MAKSKISGSWGEALAADYLRKKKFKILAVGYQCRFGEVDLIAHNRKNLIFVEVKTRKNADFAAAMEFVDRNKQDRIRMTASLFLSQYPTKLQPRFDVIEIYAPLGVDSEKPEIRHMEDAFQ